jgi:DNA-binding NarL/FixJ family response regulator
MLLRRVIVMALTERERKILRLKADGLSDYKIAHKLKMETPNVTRSRKNALKKLEHAQEDLEFIGLLKASGPTIRVLNPGV